MPKAGWVLLGTWAVSLVVLWVGALTSFSAGAVWITANGVLIVGSLVTLGCYWGER